jgi:hypothetical protein
MTIKRRKLKVYYQMVPAGREHGGTQLPLIRIQGKWLQELGFNPGDPITVRYIPGVKGLIMIENTKEAK